ncbi:S8 family serine peptidase [Paenibacillus sp. L3-i20]|uniref:S8 family peptidase n=1 Tax=Paenibacillus sp. L3-i20 TaxID=2905833 RepID=UPI001EDD0D6A|nr:S8 family serine peptidase [Paenibacillus sp. L3-i20]GKU76401.1 hypothetical protein L3i20_v207980 [Paenibacillus sp. L3-i20]
MKNRKLIKRIIVVISLVSLLFASQSAASTEQMASSTENYYTILLKKNKNVNDFISNVEQLGLQVAYYVSEVGIVQVKATEEEIELLGEIGGVDTFNPSLRATKPPVNHVFEVQSAARITTLWDYQWDMIQVTANGQSYDTYAGSNAVVVGVIDSGIDADHPDLVGNLMQGSKNLVPALGYRGEEPQEFGEINNIEDLSGHGTHVAGQIGANGLIKGVAPNVGMKIYRVFGGSSADSVWIIKAIIEAANDDVDVINLSLGEYVVEGDDDDRDDQVAELEGYERAIKYAIKKGSAVVAAVGNDSLNFDNEDALEQYIEEKFPNSDEDDDQELLDVPADIKGVVTVSSIGPTNEHSIFTNYGSDLVDIAAPGGDLRLYEQYGPEKWVADQLFMKENILSTALNGGYTFGAGTSSAAPKVAGALALIIEKFQLKDNPEKAIKILYEKGIDRNNQIDERYVGHGVLNVYEALK